MSTIPDLPEPVHADVDSLLCRRYGKEVSNYFSGSPLNRVSFLRTDQDFLSAAVKHPSASFLIFKSLAPLSQSPSKLAWVGYDDVSGLVGDGPFSRSEQDVIADFNSVVTVPQLVFLGIDEKRAEDGLRWKKYAGAPFWALDVAPKGTVVDQAGKVVDAVQSRGLKFVEGRLNSTLAAPEAAIYAQARAMLDWNARNPYCAQCGQPTLSINGGAKRACPPADLSLAPTAASQGTADQTSTSASDITRRPPCATRKGVHNISFPRTDPTVIMAVVSHDGRRVLLGRQKRWPPFWYSTLAGFIEPGESVEEAVRREVWEEAGVSVGRVVLHSTQPWPFPNSLMIGAIAQTVPDPASETIALTNDEELEQAKWVSMEEAAEALEVGTSGLGEEPGDGYKPGGLRLPPKTAIANRLLAAIVETFKGGDLDRQGSKI